MKETVIMGIDLSTSSTGVAIVQGEELLYDGVLSIKKPSELHFFELTQEYENFLKPLIQKYNPEFYFVEAPAKAMGGGSNNNTIMRLYTANHLCCYWIEKETGKRPIHFMPSTIRAMNGVEIKRGIAKKEVKKTVLDKVIDLEPSFSYELTRQGNPQPGTYDRADAVLVARAGQKHVRTNYPKTNPRNPTEVGEGMVVQVPEVQTPQE